MSVHSPNCEYCAYVSWTRLTARTDSARSTFCDSRWTRAATLRFGLMSAAATTWSAPSAASIARAHTDVRRRTRDGLVIEATQESFAVGNRGETILQRCAATCQSVTTVSTSGSVGNFRLTRNL